ncbi:hypothetical protein GCM10017772_03950 [Promicromonospora soli]|uniref:Uncharacterized protein n=1 Tax=Promicromonospora soli TaxID=2035533 RepID=A0A919FHY0_9MICO|nr:hypothetical protein GCM10017772_03950 [Promicromonospora soli]
MASTDGSAQRPYFPAASTASEAPSCGVGDGDRRRNGREAYDEAGRQHDGTPLRMCVSHGFPDAAGGRRVVPVPEDAPNGAPTLHAVRAELLRPLISGARLG